MRSVCVNLNSGMRLCEKLQCSWEKEEKTKTKPGEGRVLFLTSFMTLQSFYEQSSSTLDFKPLH